jgi:orotate phosphoribosyltransferase
MERATVTSTPTAHDVAQAIVDTGGYLIAASADPHDFFTWRCGLRAPVYTDCRVVSGYPEARSVIVRALCRSVSASFPAAELLAGMADGGIMWSAWAALDLDLPHCFVRKQKKTHGRPRLVECSPPEGVSAVLVDDVMASGSSLERAVIALRAESQIRVIGIQTIVNHGFAEMRERFQRLGVPVCGLVSFAHLLAAALDAGTLAPTVASELELFYCDPYHHIWRPEALVALSDRASAMPAAAT